MTNYLPLIPLDKKQDSPLYLQIELFLVGEIRAGKLKENDYLPGYRKLAVFLGVNGSTVLEAYQHLRQRGWLRNEVGKRFYVSLRKERKLELEEHQKPSAAQRESPVYRLDQPFAEVQAPRGFKWNMERTLADRGSLGDAVLEYINLEIADGLSRENLWIGAGHEHIFGTVATHLLRGRMVLVAMPCDPAIPRILENVGALVLPFAIWERDGGFSVLRLEGLVRQHKFVSALVIDSLHLQLAGQQPTADEAREIIRLSKHYGFLVMEHHTSRELCFGNLPKAVILSDTQQERVVYTGYLSELIMPLHTFGMVCGPAAFISKLATHRQPKEIAPGDFFSDLVHAYIRSRSYLLQQAGLKRSYLRLRRAVEQLINTHLGEFVRFAMPAHGLACWLYLREGLPLEQTCLALKENGLVLGHPERYGTAYGYPDALLFGFARIKEDELAGIIARMGDIMGQVRSQTGYPG